jgi:hypothetical protein
MSNGPYGQIACDCGAVSLLVCGSPLGLGLDAGGDPVAFWPLEAIKIGQGSDELALSPDGRGGDFWGCRRCDERLLYAHDDAEVAVLEGHPEELGDLASGLTSSRQRRLEELGYRMV